ncbi:MAG: putative motility protein [Hydrogenophaga sp.]|jgi:hypothetical protein|nr:putative motility protein [Hydrogenophaga sp.]
MDMNISPALLVDRVLQTQHIQSTQDAQINLLKKAMDAQATASMALLNAVAGDLPLASDGSVGTQVNTLV